MAYNYVTASHIFQHHCDPDKMADISQMTLSNTFSWMKMLEFVLQFHWSLFLSAQLTIIQHLSGPMTVRLLAHICITWPQWNKVEVPLWKEIVFIMMLTFVSIGPHRWYSFFHFPKHLTVCIVDIIWLLTKISSKFHIILFAEAPLTRDFQLYKKRKNEMCQWT